MRSCALTIGVPFAARAERGATSDTPNGRDASPGRSVRVSLRGVGWLVIGGLCGWTWARGIIESRSRPSRVSRRQAQILGLVARGFSTKEIARREGITEHSVNTHIRRARHALGVPSRAAAVAALGREPQTPARPRRSAMRVSATTISPTSSSNGN